VSTPFDRWCAVGGTLGLGEVGADGRDGGLLVLGVVDLEADEDVQRVLPVCVGPLMLAQFLMGVGEPVVGPGLILRLVQLGGEGEGLVVVGEGGGGVAGGVV
jgi:hypothetical protein